MESLASKISSVQSNCDFDGGGDISLPSPDLHLQLCQYANDLRYLLNSHEHLNGRLSALYRLYAQLDDTHDAFERLFGDDRDIHIITDIDGHIMLSNPAAKAIAPRTNLSGSPLKNWIHESDKSRFDALHNSVVEQAVRCTGDEKIVLRCLARETKPVLVSMHVFGIAAHDAFNALHWVMRNPIEHKSHVAEKTNPLPSPSPANSQTHSAEDSLFNQLGEDPVTGFAGRPAFEEKVTQVLAQAQKLGSTFSVMTIAILNLEIITQKFGIPGKTLVLQRTAEQLRYILRDTDAIARIADDQFAILLRGVSGDWNISRLCKKVLLALTQQIVIQGKEVYVEGRVGCSEFPRHGTTEPLLIKNSEIALERAISTQGIEYEIFERLNLDEYR